ncbi:MAG: hypothetical protein K0U84_17425 [Actinomycetia bacterium]|nr:hypothetical protein [Actinomycetes bacterium]
MTGTNHLDYDTALLDVSLDRVLVGEGLLGTRHAGQSHGCLSLPKECS